MRQYVVAVSDQQVLPIDATGSYCSRFVLQLQVHATTPAAGAVGGRLCCGVIVQVLLLQLCRTSWLPTQ
jgi:hypothetical protein